MEFGVYLSLILVVSLAVLVPVLMLTLGTIIGPRKPSEVKQSVYECGVTPEVDARRRFSVKFYQVAILFLVFDIEVAFLYPWASLFRELSCTGPLTAAGVCSTEPSLFGLVEMLIFLGILVVGLAYIWRKKALDWA